MNQIVNIDTIIIDNDRIRKNYGDINALADNIAANGLINPPTVTPDMRLLAGERRIKAAKSLGWTQIEVRVMDVKDAEHELKIEIAENKARKQFSKSERIECAKRLERVLAMKAEQRMKAGKAQDTDPMENFPQGTTRDITAKEMGIGSGKQYEKEKYIYENRDSLPPDDFAEWDEGRMSTNKLYQKIKEKQKADQDRAEQAERKNKQLRKELEDARNIEPETKVITKEVIPDDYEKIKAERDSLISENKLLQRENEVLNRDYQKRQKEVLELRNKVDTFSEDSKVEGIESQLKSECIFFCSRCDSFLKAVGGYAYLVDHLNNLPKTERTSYERAANAMYSWSQNIVFAMRETKKASDIEKDLDTDSPEFQAKIQAEQREMFRNLREKREKEERELYQMDTPEYQAKYRAQMYSKSFADNDCPEIPDSELGLDC